MARYAAWALLSVIAGVSVWIRLSHPDMTETRLFLEFWWVWLMLIALGALSVALFVGSSTKRS